MVNPHPADRISLGTIVRFRDFLLKRMAEGHRVTRFESGDPSFVPPAHVIEAFSKALADGKTHYCLTNGIPELRKAVHRKLVEKNKINWLDPEKIFITTGGMNALYLVFFALLDSGDEVIIPDPMWPEIEYVIKLCGGTAVPVRLVQEKEYLYDVETIKKAIGPKTKAVFVNSPHNPTGTVIARSELAKIVDLCRQKQLYLISDEAYEDIHYDGRVHTSPASLSPDGYDKIISIYSLSKTYAMAGLRLGYFATTSAILLERMPKIMRCVNNCVSVPTQWAAVAAIDGPQDAIEVMCKEYLRRRKLMCEFFAGIEGVKPFTPHGSFFLWVLIDQALFERKGLADAEELSEHLIGYDLGSVPGTAFGTWPNALRFSFSIPADSIEFGLDRLGEFFKQ